MSHEEINPDKEELDFIAILQAKQGLNAETREAKTRSGLIFLECEIAYKSLIARKKLNPGGNQVKAENGAEKEQRMSPQGKREEANLEDTSAEFARNS